MTSENLMKLQGLFRELFQLDMADLDFGLYRLFNIKRHEIENFLTKQLPKEVDEKFQILTEQDKADYREYLEKLEGKIKDDFPPDTLLANGDVNPAYRDAPLVKRYLDQKERIERIDASEEQKADVFNHLFNFFSRYYDEGDFIPKRFYGSRESYAVPYNGEEVFFHWANKDQHYVKSGENFRDYSFKVEGLGTAYLIRFILSDATTPKDNTKGEYRYFFPQQKKITFDKKAKTLILPFEYRLPTAEEVQKYGTKTKGQDAILVEAVPKVMEAVPDDMLRDLLGEVVHKTDKEDVTFLLKRLRHFTRKNTTDYFIHKNLEGFLNQELEFYIKDQMLHLADLEADFDQKRLMLRVFHHLADTIVTFLSQIEEVQKRLFEKKKFVLETNYCITLDRVPEGLYPEIAVNDAQREEWVKLFAIDEIEGNLIVPAYSEPLTVLFLKANQYLVLDTRHFSEGFKLRLIAAIEDLDEQCDGVLVHSENSQALNLMRVRYRKQVKCIYIDPPYNTGADGFVFKDNYQHSTWLSMIRDRVEASNRLLQSDGVLFCSIDRNEQQNLRQVLDSIYSPSNNLGEIIWHNARDNNPTQVALEHEYIHCVAKSFHARENPWKSPFSDAKKLMLNLYLELKAKGMAPVRLQKKLREFIRDNRELLGEIDRYKFVDEEGIYTGSESVHNPHPGGYEYDIPHPKTGKSMRKPANGYRFPEKTMREQYIKKARLIYGPDEKRIVKIKLYLDEHKDSLRSVISLDGRLGAYSLRALFGESETLFSNPKPVQLIQRFLGFIGEDATVLDYFAGSGTTVHAILNIERFTGKKFHYVLVEMADYFDTVLIPRIKKVIYSKDWKNGKPVSREGISHMFKYIRLESYEDALHNLSSDGTMARIKSKEEAYKAAKGENEYRIRYLAKLPLEASDTMLNLAKLEHPFNYTLEILTDDGPREQAVDLVETFNLLYGLSVRRLETWTDEKDGRSYRIVKATNRDGLKSILVVWRDMADLDPKIERKFLEGMLKMEEEFDEKLINGDTATPGFQSLDHLFKRLMEAG